MITKNDILLDPTAVVTDGCGDGKTALTAHHLMIQARPNVWINFVDWLILLHLNIHNLKVKTAGDSVEVSWTGTNNVLIYVDSKEGQKPTSDNRYVLVVGRGVHHIKVQEIGERVGLEADVDVKGTIAVKAMHINVTKVNQHEFTITSDNYTTVLLAINGALPEQQNLPLTINGLKPEQTTQLVFSNVQGERIGQVAVKTDSDAHKAKHPIVPAGQVFPIPTNSEVGAPMGKLTFYANGAAVTQAEVMPPLGEHFVIMTDGTALLKKPIDYPTLNDAFWKEDPTGKYKEFTGRVSMINSAGGTTQFVSVRMVKTDVNAPTLASNTQISQIENKAYAVGEAAGAIAVAAPAGHNVSRIDVAKPLDTWLMVDPDGTIKRTGVPIDFEKLDKLGFTKYTPHPVTGAQRKMIQVPVTAVNDAGSVSRMVTFDVSNVADTPPVFPDVTLSVDEGTAVNAIVDAIVIDDAGSPITSAVVSSELLAYVAISNAGTVKMLQTLDYEAMPSAFIKDPDNGTAYVDGQVTVTNLYGSTIKKMRLTVKNVKDDIPKVSTYHIDVEEGVPVGTTVGKIPVDDQGSSLISVAIGAPLSSMFAVDIQGNIRVNAPIDFEALGTPQWALVDQKWMAQAQATATNKWGSDTGTLVISIVNKSDVPASIPVAQQFTAKENATAGTYVGTLQYAEGEDRATNFTIYAPASKYFDISSAGQITVKLTPDYETLQSTWAKNPTTHAATATSVKVKMSLLSGGFVEQFVAFTISDEADTPPTIQPNQKLSVTENVAIGTITTALAYDDNRGPVIAASITAPASNFFDISPVGVITTKQTFDFEAMPPAFGIAGNEATIDTMIALTNAAGTSTMPIKLQVLDKLDNAATATSPQTFSTVENVPIGTKLGTVQFNDNGTALSSAVVGAPMDALLRIDPITGDILTIAPIDFEALPTTVGSWSSTTPGTMLCTTTFTVSNVHGSAMAVLKIKFTDIAGA